MRQSNEFPEEGRRKEDPRPNEATKRNGQKVGLNGKTASHRTAVGVVEWKED